MGECLPVASEWLEVVDRTYNGAKIINPGRIVEVPKKSRSLRRCSGLLDRMAETIRSNSG